MRVDEPFDIQRANRLSICRGPIPFPIIADLDMNVASLYGMIHPGQSSTAAVRAVFFIDDKAANVEAARARGWRAAVWTGRDRLADLIGL